jgi:uncharacterized heparinase superfamily protein
MLHTLYRPTKLLFDPSDKRAAVAPIHPQMLYAGKLSLNALKQLFCSFWVGCVRG